jgi:fructose-1,6-bisphosphatase II
MTQEPAPELTVSPSRNIGLELLRVTEATALAAGRWIGSGRYTETHDSAARTAAIMLNRLFVDGLIVIGEEGRTGYDTPLSSGKSVGNGQGPAVDVLVDPIDGTSLVTKGYPGAISAVAIAPRGSIWCPFPAVYMEKVIVDRDTAAALVPETLDAPVAWTLALIARAKSKPVRDLDVVVLERDRHAELVQEIRATGARVWFHQADTEGALLAAMAGKTADVALGIGGALETMLAACAVRALRGGMMARLAPQSTAEREALEEAGHDVNRIYTVQDLVSSDEVFLSATGVTRSDLFREVDFHGETADFDSLLIRGETGTRRFVHTEQFLSYSHLETEQPTGS